MLIDTSGLLCAHNSAEPFHRQASLAISAAVRRLTHNYVLTEFVALAHTRRMPRLPALEVVADLQTNSAYEIVWVDEQLHQKGMALLRARLDKTYSLCDAISFVNMRELGIQDALTTDRHYDQEGFRRLLV